MFAVGCRLPVPRPPEPPPAAFTNGYRRRRRFGVPAALIQDGHAIVPLAAGWGTDVRFESDAGLILPAEVRPHAARVDVRAIAGDAGADFFVYYNGDAPAPAPAEAALSAASWHAPAAYAEAKPAPAETPPWLKYREEHGKK